MKNLLSSTRNRVIAAVLLVVLVLIGAVAGAFVYFSSHALPGSAVGSVAVGGMTRAEAKAAIEQHFASQDITVQSPAGSVDTSLEKAGVAVDVDRSVDAVFAQPVIPGVFGVKPITPVVTVDDKTLDGFAKTLPLPSDSAAVESSVTFDSDAGQFVAQAGTPGKAIDIPGMKTSLMAVAEEQQSGPVEVGLVEVQPTITVENATATAASVNQWLSVPISVTDSDGDTNSADASTRAAWVTFAAKDTSLVPSIDAKAVQAWIADYAKYTEDAPVVGLRNVDASGKELSVSKPAVDGWKVTNVDAIVKQIADSISSDAAVEAVFEYGDAKATWEDRPAAPGSENLVYHPAVGEKWIDLNLGAATVTAYVGTEVVGGPFYVVPGAPETPTVEGEYNIYLKYAVQDMKGQNADGTNYETKDVPWISYFYAGYAFHGAPWRSSFGWNGPGGSHGCVNMPVLDAKWIYDWAEVGTKVVSHY